MLTCTIPFTSCPPINGIWDPPTLFTYGFEKRYREADLREYLEVHKTE